jgi:O-antigen ligase
MGRAVNTAVIILLGAGPAAVAARLVQAGFMDPMLAGVLVGALAASILVGCILFARGNVLVRAHPALVMLALYAGVAILSAAAAKSPELSLRASAHLLIFAGAAYFLSQALMTTGNARGPLAVSVVAAGLFSAHALIQFTGRDVLAFQIPYRNDFLRGFQVYSVFGNPNLLGDYLAISFPIILGLWLSARRTGARMLFMTCGVLAATALCLTVSRGAIMGAAAGVAVFMAARFAGRNRAGLAAAAAILVITAGMGATLMLGRGQAKSESMNMREITRGATWLMVRDNPGLGVGFDRYRHEHLTYQAAYFANPDHQEYAYLANREKQRHAHNEFMQITAETGVPGLAVFLGFLAALALPLVRAARGRTPDACAAALLGSGAAFCAVSIFSFPLRVPQTAALLCVLAACAMALAPHTAARESNAQLPLARLRVEAAAILILLAGFAAWTFVIQPYRSVEHRLQGEAALRAGNPLQASNACLTAYRLDRFSGEALYCLGLAQLHMNHPEDAAFDFDQALRYIDDPLIHYVYGRALRAAGGMQDAEKQLLIMEGMLPQHLAPKLALASLYEHMGRPRELRAARQDAVALLEREHERSGADFNRILDIARLHYALGDKAKYKLWLKRAQAMNPESPAIHRELKNLSRPQGGR